MTFIPSIYQQDVFDFVKFGYGNALICARAGSAKTTTIIKALDFIKPDKKVLFLAFNNSIVNELKTKITRKNTDINTLHSLGFSILRSNFKDKEIKIYEDKYKDKLRDFSDEIVIENGDLKRYTKNVIKLCNYGRYYLVKGVRELEELSIKYGLSICGNEVEIGFELINWGKHSLEKDNVIDFGDMLYLPNVLNLKPFKYDFIIVDEAQDLSTSQMNLFLKCFKQGGRFIAVGDDRQTIYGFSGSDIESFNKLKKLPNTIELPLPICYRCPKKIIINARKWVPDIEYPENAIEGIIEPRSKIESLIDGDMVICRNTLPLIKLYNDLINRGVKCYVVGKDIGTNLNELINYSNEEYLNISLNNKGLFSDLYKLLFIFVENIKISFSKTLDDVLETQEYNEFLDKIECLEIISRGLETKQELIDKINSIFSDENKQGIKLSTIHKAKGLESDNVYILNRNLIPSKFAKLDWELKQEENLDYVACTRSKKKLGFIYDSDNTKINNNEDQLHKYLNLKEKIEIL